MKNYSVITLLLLCISLHSQNTKYIVRLDLNNVDNDRIQVNITVPEVADSSIEYHMPKIVPGTYSISDFGRFVNDLQAVDSMGNELKVERISTNRWNISDATRLSGISYWIHDTFDKTEGYDDNIIFEPGGTSIEKDRNVFVLNTFGIIGYLQGMKMIPFEVSISHPEKLYGATSLKRTVSSPTEDIFTATNYHFLADAPIMYSEPDTVTKKIAGAEIIISVFSPNKKLSAMEVLDNIDNLMEAQSKYLGGDLPVDRYAYLIYLLDYPSLSRAMGALEHSYSSLYTLPEYRADILAQTIRDVAAHEFLHIVTPLNIHSEEIHNFNYIEPEMSKHLWLYEGVTEYSSLHVQVRNNLYDGDTFLSEIRKKMQTAEQFPEVSFTEMSERILEPRFEPMFQNVYYKGALIGMCLDLYLIKYTNGEMDLPMLMQELAKTYGPHKAFKDEDLFDEIVKLTVPEIGTFFETYVEGNTPLPIQECLSWAGVNYLSEEETAVTTLGNIQLRWSEEERIVASTSNMNEFGKSFGWQEGDAILDINGTELTIDNFESLLDEIKYDYVENDKIKITVLRDIDGNEKKVKLKGKVTKIMTYDRHKIEFDTEPSEEQRNILLKWLYGT